MAVKCSVFIAVSLDGYIARKNGDLSWLTDLPEPRAGEDYGFGDFFSSVDALVMGRKTFEAALAFADWPYSGKRVVVLSHNSPPVPDRLSGQIEVMAGDPVELVDQLEKSGARTLYIDGGETIQRFLAAGLIDEMTITTIPILLGEGIPLFGKLDHEIQLELVKTQGFQNGLVQNKYRLAEKA